MQATHDSGARLASTASTASRHCKQPGTPTPGAASAQAPVSKRSRLPEKLHADMDAERKLQAQLAKRLKLRKVCLFTLYHAQRTPNDSATAVAKRRLFHVNDHGFRRPGKHVMQPAQLMPP
jgi:hypothetical protein